MLSPDPTVGDAARLRGWRRWFVTVYGIASVFLFAAVVIGAVAAAHRHPGRPVHWWLVTAFAVGIIVVIGVVGAVGWRVQTRPGRTRQLFAAGNWRTNRRVGMALRRGREIEPVDRRSAQAIVDLYAHRRWVVWFYAGLGVFWLALSFGYHGFQFGLHIALGLLYLGFTPYWVLLRRRTLRNAARQGFHPSPDTQHSTP